MYVITHLILIAKDLYMNLKEYNYCKRHHPRALSRYFNIKINSFTSYGEPSEFIHDATCFHYKHDAKYHYLNTSAWLSLNHLL